MTEFSSALQWISYQPFPFVPSLSWLHLWLFSIHALSKSFGFFSLCVHFFTKAIRDHVEFVSWQHLIPEVFPHFRRSVFLVQEFASVKLAFFQRATQAEPPTRPVTPTLGLDVLELVGTVSSWIGFEPCQFSDLRFCFAEQVVSERKVKLLAMERSKLVLLSRVSSIRWRLRMSLVKGGIVLDMAVWHSSLTSLCIVQAVLEQVALLGKVCWSSSENAMGK